MNWRAIAMFWLFGLLYSIWLVLGWSVGGVCLVRAVLLLGPLLDVAMCSLNETSDALSSGDVVETQ